MLSESGTWELCSARLRRSHSLGHRPKLDQLKSEPSHAKLKLRAHWARRWRGGAIHRVWTHPGEADPGLERERASQGAWQGGLRAVQGSRGQSRPGPVLEHEQREWPAGGAARSSGAPPCKGLESLRRRSKGRRTLQRDRPTRDGSAGRARGRGERAQSACADRGPGGHARGMPTCCCDRS